MGPALNASVTSLATSTRKMDKKPTYVFSCPVCLKEFRHDEPGEPCCTGPSETRDEHPMEVMRLARVENREVGATYAERRAAGMLLMPGGFGDEIIAREVKLATI